jgi:N-acetyl-anhydromuramyl-L-alanine amidase AmpD
MDKRTKTDIIVIHCTQTPSDMDVDVEKVIQWHKNRGFDTIGYHYLIKRDGTLQVGRDEDVVGAHAVQVNGTSIGVALVGGGTVDMGWENNFESIQFETLKSILLKLKDKYNIEKIIGHYQVDDKKKCPSFDVPKWLEENGLV